MGTETRTFTFAKVKTESELRNQFKIQKSEDSYERGNGAYEGSLASINDLSIHRQSFATLEAARKFADNEFVEKRCAVALRYGDATKAFPYTEKDKALEAMVKKLDAELLTFENDILKRFVESKSASKKCTHCESVISKKSRERMAKEDFQRELNRIEGYFEKKDYIKERTSCPACGGNLLITDTDAKRKTSLETRQKEAAAKLRSAKESFDAKNKQEFGYLVIAACAS